jgi:hypothetical protein
MKLLFCLISFVSSSRLCMVTRLQNMDGMDMRFNLDISNTNKTELAYVTELLQKKKLLDILQKVQKENISKHETLKLLRPLWPNIIPFDYGVWLYDEPF